MSAATTTAPVLDGEAHRLLVAAEPLHELDLRYLRKAIRYRLGHRGTRPSPWLGPAALEDDRVRELDRLADWIVQAGA